ncbi:AraC family transcriptional regulator [Paenibacillus pectinilyticus]|uniref:AraC family transcriptional regulator n=2 Tax=Paenibacillus pectinilyticus TaxID=512399 RepID=A0A1C1A5F2_9BACL|nr:helix-turn-helix domain-containing protein [Paenibacillus pectinilyticus]OCT15766.1 AraC family transcriptional regulator [Paenibacillus pectinilyticus]
MPHRASLFPDLLSDPPSLPQVVAYYFKQWQGFYMPFHRHDATEIMYTIQGFCNVEIVLSPTNTARVRLKKGEFILLNANIAHRLIVEDEEPCRMLNVEFRFTAHQGDLPSIQQLAFAEKQLASLLEVQTSYLVLRDPDEVYHVMKSLVLELDRTADKSETMIQLLISQLLIRIARLRRETVSSSLVQSEWYAKVSMDYMHQNYDREIQVKDIAAAVNLHPGYLQRIFKTVTGQTLMAYLTNIRMEKAQMLLLETDVPIADISDYIGIGSRQYFHMLFKTHTNLTPTDYRKSMNKHKFDHPEGS